MVKIVCLNAKQREKIFIKENSCKRRTTQYDPIEYQHYMRETFFNIFILDF